MTLFGCRNAGTDTGFAYACFRDLVEFLTQCCGNLSFPACFMTLDDILLQPTHLTVVAWAMSDHSDTIVSSLFWLPPAACWSWCVFHPQCVSVCAMLNRLQLCVTSHPKNSCHSRQGHNSPIVLTVLTQDHTHRSSPSLAICFWKQTFNMLFPQCCLFPALLCHPS